MAETFAVEARGVGRKDYSSGIELSVEPTVRSYQEEYNYWDDGDIPANSYSTVSIAVPSGRVIIIYDYYLSTHSNRLLKLESYSVDAGVYTRILTASNYCAIARHAEKGYTYLDTIALYLYNYAPELLDVWYGIAGIILDREEYYLSLEE